MACQNLVTALGDTPHLKLPVGSSNADNCLVSDYLRRHHRQGFALGRVDLARHDTTPGLILGKTDFPETATGARAQVTDVVCDLHQRASNNVERAVSLNECIMCSKRLELVNNRSSPEC
jgi:hypothetical protein